ncbi:hypothetical protein JOF29_005946 [Kribbella aluminosa]|uniref:FHA domain-containing protein n=1 Tax=Kribbella aluminosa TaxID=416017 RepID=A0ABS4UTF3_9ACTN|nr:hypothetical protein [Kribbella aluminosa]MBP2354836.1 hypothetical protein [Kribbella aluminosa]
MIRRLPQDQASLASGVPDARPGTIFVLSVEGGVSADPGAHRILFGRNRAEVHVSAGQDDQRVSRMHGSISYRTSQWWVAVTGRLPVRFPREQMLFGGEDPMPLAAGYTPLFVQGTWSRTYARGCRGTAYPG